MALVYSSGKGRICPVCGWPADDCKCSARNQTASVPEKVVAKLRLETKGRGGKSVSVIYDLPDNAAFLKTLCQELKRAKVVASEEVPTDVVTMNSVVRLKDLKKSNEMEITVVYPKDADLNSRKISVLAPVATAILGCKVGDEVEWPAPQGMLSYKIESIVYQPEAAGDLYL